MGTSDQSAAQQVRKLTIRIPDLHGDLLDSAIVVLASSAHVYVHHRKWKEGRSTKNTFYYERAARSLLDGVECVRKSETLDHT